MRWVLGIVLALVGLVALLGAGAYFALKRPDLPYETLAARFESASSRYVDLPGGIRMHYRDEGAQGGPPLLLIHGFSASLHTWEPWIARLGNDYRIISIDLPGHGLTRAPAGYHPSIEAFRDVVAEFTRSQNLERFALAGSSMGGNVAWEYALAHPGQVDALILVDASGWEDTRPEAAEEPQVFKLLRNPTLGPIMIQLDNSRLVRQGLEASFADATLVDDTMLERYTQLARAPGHREILLQLSLDFRSRNYATSERLAALDMPVLVLTGDTDRLVPPEHAQQFHDAITGAELVTFEATGHIPQEERPDESAQAVRDFLQRQAQTSALPALPELNCATDPRC